MGPIMSHAEALFRREVIRSTVRLRLRKSISGFDFQTIGKLAIIISNTTQMFFFKVYS